MTIESAPARHYGIFGLVVSILFIVVVTLVFAAAVLGLIALGDVLIFGRAHLADVFTAAGDAIASSDKSRMITPTLAFGCVLYIAAVAAVFALARWRGGAHWRSLVAWRPMRADRPYWLMVAGAVAYGFLAGFLVQYFYPDAKDWFQLPRDPLGLALTFFLAVIMAPLAEELVFRGWLFTGLRARASFPTTLVITSLLFALAHWERTHLYALAVFPVGLLLGYVRERAGSVRATMIMHAIYNGSALFMKLLFPDV